MLCLECPSKPHMDCLFKPSFEARSTHGPRLPSANQKPPAQCQPTAAATLSACPPDQRSHIPERSLTRSVAHWLPRWEPRPHRVKGPRGAGLCGSATPRAVEHKRRELPARTAVGKRRAAALVRCCCAQACGRAPAVAGIATAAVSPALPAPRRCIHAPTSLRHAGQAAVRRPCRTLATQPGLFWQVGKSGGSLQTAVLPIHTLSSPAAPQPRVQVGRRPRPRPRPAPQFPAPAADTAPGA
eukprot:354981-Chlamydomonas_euryale.AAC.1